MSAPQPWRSLKVRSSQYEALAACSDKTGRSIIQLADEALRRFILDVVPVYNRHAELAQATIERRAASQPRRKGPRRLTQKDPIETVTIPA